MFERKSLKWPILLAVVMIVLISGLTTGWVLLNVFGAIESESSASLYWTLLSIGSVMFACVLTGVILYLILTIKQHNLTSRQSNFIDAVTHELKSPIAALKLYLQTLDKRSNIEAAQRQEFYSSMLMEVERLDQLINQLLDVARLSHGSKNEGPDPESCRIDEVLPAIIQEACARHNLETDKVGTHLEPIEIRCRKADLELVIRNLLDNAAKYAGSPPAIEIIARLEPESTNVAISIENNGHSIPRHLRRLIFQRFYRIGNELERTKQGTGLGLYLVKLIVKQMRGKIGIVDARNPNSTKVLLRLPNARLVPLCERDAKLVGESVAL